MIVVEIVRGVLVAYAAFWAFYVLAIPVLAALRRSRGEAAKGSSENQPNVVVIVPAHNMERVIARCVGSLAACDYPREKLEIYVAADHCTDDTEERARAAGASVLVREEGERGKTYTLAWTLEVLAGRGIAPDVYVIVDATVRVDAAFLKSLTARCAEGEDIVISHPVVDAENQQWFAQCQGLTLAHRNLQNWARERLGLSAFIGGRGMAYSRRYIQRFGWSLALPTSSRFGSHPTEDYRHGVRAVEQGYRAAFADDARVFTPLRGSLSAATEQGVRWEQGRMINALTDAPRLLLLGLRERNAVKLLSALDGIQPPVAILIGFCAGVAAFSAAVPGSRLAFTLGIVPLLLVGLYGLAVVAQGRRDGIRLRTVIWAPVYIAWRCMAFVLAWTKKQGSRA